MPQSPISPVYDGPVPLSPFQVPVMGSEPYGPPLSPYGMLSDRLYVCLNAVRGQCNDHNCGLVHPGMCVLCMCVYMCEHVCVLYDCVRVFSLLLLHLHAHVFGYVFGCISKGPLWAPPPPPHTQNHTSVVIQTTPSRCARISCEGTATETSAAIATLLPTLLCRW